MWRHDVCSRCNRSKETHGQVTNCFIEEIKRNSETMEDTYRSPVKIKQGRQQIQTTSTQSPKYIANIFDIL
jgi:hypothetical protein